MRRAVATADERPSLPRPAAATAGARTLETLVIVGNGMVGHRLCRRLVELGASDRYHIVVFGEEPHPAYDRVHLTELFAGRGEDDLLLAPAAWYREHGIDLRLGNPIVAIDREARIATSASGAEIEYGRLVLATGASPYVPPIEGASAPGVFLYRTLDDLRAIRRQARQANRAAVIGGGLLGLEAARALERLGLRVTIIEAAASLMPAQLDQRGGKALEEQVASFGIDIRTGSATSRIEACASGLRTLHFVGGDSLTVDIVVIATGVRPRNELARRCGLARSPEGGIVVDDRLRTSDPHIFAAGDCAAHRLRVHGLVAPGYAMADTLAMNLTGRDRAFSGEAPAVRLKLLGVQVASAGEPLNRGVAVRHRGGRSYRLIRLERGRLVGALGVGDWPEFNRMHDAAAGRAPVWARQAARFERTGTLWRAQQDLPTVEWPAHAVVCQCLHVTRGRIAAACADGARSVDSVAECTGASTVCGSCRPLLAQLVDAGTPQPVRIARGLLGASLAAVVVAIAVLMLAPVPFATSVQEALRIDVLWRHGVYRQISGFTLLGVSLAASLLTFRRRLRIASSLGAFPVWRMAHVLLGLLALMTLAVHTGLRLGDNLNFALIASFGVLNVLGGIAGGITAIEQRLGPRAGRRFRSALVTAHILAIWPLPVLLAFHVVAVYYF